MSKFVKQLQVSQLRRHFKDANDVLVVNVIGLDAIGTTALRSDLRKKGIRVTVVKNNLAKVVFAEKGMQSIGGVLTGPSAIAWGGADVVELAREITARVAKEKKLEIRGGVVMGQQLDKAGVEQLSKMPGRPELLSNIAGLILAPGANLAAALNGPGGALASQVKSFVEKLEKESPAESAASAPAAPA